MAPTTTADAQTVQKMLDIKRTVWMNKKDIVITPGTHVRKNGRPNKNIRINRSIELMPFRMNGMEEDSLRVYIADPWPVDYESIEMNEKLRRAEQGQGPTVRMGRVVPDAEGRMSVVLGQVLSPTQKHWKRSDRRRKATVARAARRRNEMAAKS